MRYKIMIVEDELIEAASFELILKSYNYEVVGIASTGEDALKKISDSKPDLVLMDIVLKGDMDGIEAASKIGEEFNIPVVYLTAHPEESTVNRAMLTSPYGFLIKPINKTTLKNTIELALYKHQVEMKLKESEKKYRNLYSLMNEGVAIHKLIYDDNHVPIDYEILDVNPAYEEILGINRNEILGKKASETYNTDYAPYLDIYSKVAKTGEPIHFETFFEPMNTYFSINVFSPAIDYFATVFEDITERKVAEEKLRKNENDLATAQRVGKIGSFHYDFTTKIENWSNELYNIFSIDPNVKMNFDKLFDYIIPEDHQILTEQREKLFREGKPVHLEFRIKTEEGVRKFVSCNIELISDNENNAVELIGTVQDITKQKKIELALEESKNHLQNLFDNAPIGIFHSSLEGKVYDVNKTYSDIFGYETPEDYISAINQKTVQDEIYVDKEKRQQFVNEVLQDYEWHSLENKYYRKDDSIMTAEVSFRAVRNPDSSIKYLEGFVTDISDRRNAMEILQIEQELAFALSESSDLTETLNICLDAAIKISKMDSGGLYLVDDETGDLELKVHSGLPPDFVAKASYYKADEPNTQLVMAGQPVYTHQKELNIPIPESDQIEKIRAIAIIPIQYQGEVIANLNIASHTKDIITDHKKNALETIANLIGGAITRSKAEKRLSESEKRYRELVDYSIVAIYKTNLKGEILFANDAMAKMFDFESVNDLKAENIIQFYKNTADRVQLIERLKKDKYLMHYDIEAVSISGRPLNLLISAYLSDNIISGMILDITERVKAEEGRKETEEKYALVVETAAEGIGILDNKGTIIDINQKALDMSGFDREELIGKNFTKLLPQLKMDIRTILSTFKEIISGFSVQAKEWTMINKLGEQVTFVSYLNSLKKDQKIIGISFILEDITERKKAEDRIKKSLNEKELLLKEIHHRVKNNLQIIHSILGLQEHYVKDDPTAVNALMESQNRVLSMAMIHEMLYESKDLSSINFSEYLRNLVTSLFHNYGTPNVESIIEVEDVFFNIETSIPLGLIISELVSNSLKYAFPSKIENGKITIKLHPYKEEHELIVSDNGIGLPKGLEITSSESGLGLKLVSSLIDQIDGSLMIEKTKGTKFIIKFKELKYKERI